MAMSPISKMKIIGIALIVVGLGLAFWGYRLSGSVGSQVTQALTGSATEKVMTFSTSVALSALLLACTFSSRDKIGGIVDLAS